MKILLLEDEEAAAARLKKMVLDIQPDAEIVGILESIKESIDFFENNKHPDLIISDIQLADGVSFEIFSQLKISVPVIFTTAYDTYMLKAFKVNSIDYLLKPIDKTELKAAIEKFEANFERRQDATDNDTLINLMRRIYPGYKTRFLVKKADTYITVPADEVSYLKAEGKIVFLFTKENQRYIIDESLDELEKLLDPIKFFRLNRQYIAPVETILKVFNHFNGKLRIELKDNPDPEIYVSRERSTEFKRWLGN